MLILITLINLILVAAKSMGPAGSTFSKLAEWDNAELASFVDMNADRRTDTVIYWNAMKQLDVLMEPNAKEAVGDITTNANHAPKRVNITHLSLSQKAVRGVVAAGFSGNSLPDFLVLTSADAKEPFEAAILVSENINVNGSSEFSDSLLVYACLALICK